MTKNVAMLPPAASLPLVSARTGSVLKSAGRVIKRTPSVIVSLSKDGVIKSADSVILSLSKDARV